MNHEMNRKDFIKTSAAAGLGVSLLAPYVLSGKDDRESSAGVYRCGT